MAEHLVLQLILLFTEEEEIHYVHTASKGL